jgi:hypothetical protein
VGRIRGSEGSDRRKKAAVPPACGLSAAAARGDSGSKTLASFRREAGEGRSSRPSTRKETAPNGFSASPAGGKNRWGPPQGPHRP